MRGLRILIVAACSAALFVLVVPAAADCPATDPGCQLSPLQSRQVNPYPIKAAGSQAQLDETAPRLVTSFTSPMSLGAGSAPAADPKFIDSVPRSSDGQAPNFPTLAVRQRYQDPSDVSCGVQALGMALDGLGSPAPASSALLDYLQGQGMMYGFGTGVEELAYAAQSFGYSDSQPFHGGSLAGLQSELAAGRPVVVDLGVNGDGQPGHFVTVTGISPDRRWIAYNDPTLGKVVVPTDEFMRQWSRQGATGVTVGPSGLAVSASVAPEPNPMKASPWLLFAASAMALLSNAGLGLRRQGIGGRVIEGTTLPRSSSSGKPKGSSPGSSKKKDKKKKSKPKASASPAVNRAEVAFEAAPPPPPAPPVPHGVARAEEAFLASAPPAPQAPPPRALSRDQELLAPAASNLAPYVGPIPPGSTPPVVPLLPTLTPTLEPGAGQPPNEETPGRAEHPSALIPADDLSRAQDEGTPDLYSIDPHLVPHEIIDPFPSVAVPYVNKNIPNTSLGIVEWGQQYGWTYLRREGNVALSPYNWSTSILGVKLEFSREEVALKATLPFGKTTAFETENGTYLTYRQSVAAKVTWDGWNTTSEISYNSVDYAVGVNSGALDDVSVSGHQGLYVKDKPYQMLAIGELTKLVIAGAILGIDEAAAIALELGRETLTGPVVTP